ncbi:MAG: AAA domain-containing protein [Acidimicrobiia bacterium]|nr:AAA domain-containing protein [Acidimicrobiia bacterium]
MAPLLTALGQLFDGSADLEEVSELLDTACAPPRGLLGGWRHRRAERRLRKLIGAGSEVRLEEIRRAADLARARRVRAELEASGGTDLEPLWADLARADEELALAVGAYITDRTRSQAAINPASRRAVAGLAAALRAGRGARRGILQRLEGESVLRALPLWVGTLKDVDHLLPATPGMFDLVLLDEASQIDQPHAAPGLLRAKRAVIAGDPHQLRHVSFVSDAAIAKAIERYRLHAAADRLDVRRLSAFDAATAVSATTTLRDHFRSVPHLIEFSSKRFYGDALHLVTRHPSNESDDAIDTIVVDGSRDSSGVNQAELNAVRGVLKALDRDGATSVGVISPFRAQADALEQMILQMFDLRDIERLGLRVGTVHSFQGSERMPCVASFAVEGMPPPAAVASSTIRTSSTC